MLRSLGYAEFGQIAPITGGWANLMWRFQTPDGARHVLRVYGRPEWSAGAFREAAALQAAAAGGIPVPRLEKFAGWKGHAVLVISWCPGRTLVSELQLRPWRLWRLAAECGRVLARIHAVPAPEALRRGAPDYWMKADLNPEAHPLPPISTDSLVHLDYHPLNILTDGRSVTAVVDWTNAAAGDPRSDVARTISILSASPPPPSPLRPLLLFAARSLILPPWLRGYQEIAGPLGDLSLYLAFSGRQMLVDVGDAVRDGRGWATERDLERIRRWTAGWEKRAGF